MPELQDRDRALSVLESARKKEPNNHMILNLLAELYIVRFDDLEQADRIVQQVLERDPEDAGALINRSRILLLRASMLKLLNR
ncbi:MAG: tetratricopeptide repeat protein [Planctomycetaceae bacterium]